MDPILFSIFIVIVVVLLFAAALMIFRAMMYGRVPDPLEPVEPAAVDGPVVAEHLASAIRRPTVSYADHDQIDTGAFNDLRAALEHMYPRIHAALKCERVGEYSLLYTWPGADDLPPILLCSHMDVVPADPSTLKDWTHPPFSGAIQDGYVWGRGTLDMKSHVITIMEAIEGLLKTGYQPERTLYLALGHDEEIGGHEGARCIADLLVERGEQLAAVFDEGGAIMQGALPGLELPIAMVGVAEKGYASLELKVEGRPGHSSMPPPHTAIGVLARAVARLEMNPMPASLRMARMLFDQVGAFLPFSTRFALANSWLLGGAVRRRLEKSPPTNAMVRTTAAATIVKGGVTDNVLPAKALAVVNCRLLPGDTRASLLEHYRKAIADEAVQITLPADTSWEPSPVSPTSSPVFESLSRTIRQVFPDTLVAPYLVSGATDSRYYLPLTDNVFRFSPYLLDNQLLRTIHGIDERISIDALVSMVQFYTQLIKSWTAGNSQKEGTP